MHKIVIAYAALLVLCCSMALAVEPSERDAVALCEKGARFIQANGKDKMIERINARDPEFNHGSLYLAMRDLNGLTVAHPTRAIIGKNLLDVPDADGKAFRHEMLAIARGKGSGWVNYKFLNPATGKVQAKTTYVLRVGDIALEAGVYKH
jgi:cytochrome c